MDDLAETAANLQRGESVRLVLKNGSKIDGVVRSSSPELIELEDQRVAVERLSDILIEESPGGIE